MAQRNLSVMSYQVIFIQSRIYHHSASYDHLITVEMMSVMLKTLNTGIFLNGTSAIPVYLGYLGIPDQKHSASDGVSEALSEAKAKWLDAFSQYQ